MSKQKVDNFTITDYLSLRMTQLGLRTLFSVPGDYTLEYLDNLNENNKGTDESLKLDIVPCSNELNAGYAADGFAKNNGLSAVTVTTGVGSFSLLNGIAGATVEMAPIIVIVGTISNDRQNSQTYNGELFHHQINGQHTDAKVYENVTCAVEQIYVPAFAPEQIDKAIISCLTYKQPVMIELSQDLFSFPCERPSDTPLTAQEMYPPMSVLRPMTTNPWAKNAVKFLDNSVNQAFGQIWELINQKKHPVIWAGDEISIYGNELVEVSDVNLNGDGIITKNGKNYRTVRGTFEYLLAVSGLYYTSSLQGKSFIAETHPHYLGVFDANFYSISEGSLMNPGAGKVAGLSADLIVGLGVWTTDVNTFGGDPTPSDILVTRNHVNFKKADKSNPKESYFYPLVFLGQFLDALAAKFHRSDVDFAKSVEILEFTKKFKATQQVKQQAVPKTYGADDILTYDNVSSNLCEMLTTNWKTIKPTLVADMGLALWQIAGDLITQEDDTFIAGSLYASIGYSLPAGFGVALANRNRRAVIHIGDGAFKMTCQSLSAMMRYSLEQHNAGKPKLNPVVILYTNNTYSIEQMVSAGTKQYCTVTPPAPALPFNPENVLMPWDITSLVRGFGSEAKDNKGNDVTLAKVWEVTTVDEYQSALMDAFTGADNDKLCVINAQIDIYDYPSSWQWMVNAQCGTK